jgi:hypothetical protein
MRHLVTLPTALVLLEAGQVATGAAETVAVFATEGDATAKAFTDPVHAADARLP